MNKTDKPKRPEDPAEIENIAELEGLTLDIRYDNVFKAVFTDEDPRSRKALSSLLSAIIGRALNVTSVLQNEPATGFAGEKQIRYDINCVFEDGSRCNAEMTLHAIPCEPVRIEYYLCKAHVGQASKGKKFWEIVPTYQVSVMNESVYRDKEYLHRFLFYDPDHRISLGGFTRVCTVELPKIEKLARCKAVKDMEPAERWAVYFLYNADKSEFARDIIGEIMQEEEGVKMAAEVMDGYTADERLYYRLLSEMKYEMDHNSLMAYAEERGEKRGEKRGREDERRKAGIRLKAEREKAQAEREKTQAEREKALAEREAAVNALKVAGVSDEVIKNAYPGARI